MFAGLIALSTVPSAASSAARFAVPPKTRRALPVRVWDAPGRQRILARRADQEVGDEVAVDVADDMDGVAEPVARRWVAKRVTGRAKKLEID